MVCETARRFRPIGEGNFCCQERQNPAYHPALEGSPLEMAPVLETSRDSEIAVRNNLFLYSGCRPWFRGLDSGLLGPAERARVRSKWPCGSNRYAASDNVPAERRCLCGRTEYLDLSGQSPTF